MAEAPRPGQPIRPDELISAQWLNALLALLKSGQIVLAPGCGLEMHHTADGGQELRALGATGMWIKITGAGSSGAYPWTEQLEAAGGTWTAGDATGTTSSDPAYELNAYNSVPTNTIVRAWRTSQGDLRFLASTC